MTLHTETENIETGSGKTQALVETGMCVAYYAWLSLINFVYSRT